MPSYFKLARRNLYRNKIYTVINIVGLALGVCACILVYLITSFELSYDNFHPDRSRIYHVCLSIHGQDGKKAFFQTAPPAAASALRQELSGLEEVAAFVHYRANISIPDGGRHPKKFNNSIEGSWMSASIIAEPQYFSIFKYDWLAGNAATALNEPFKVVLTESRARMYFGPQPLKDIIGKAIIYDDSLLVSVSGIIKDWAGNTDFPFTDFISFSTIKSSFLGKFIQLNEWQDMDVWTLIKLSNGVTPAAVDKQLSALVKSHVKQSQDARLPNLELSLRPLSKLHFDSSFEENEIRTADSALLYSLLCIALLILVLAVANFINLSTAQSFQRTKEVGIRKLLGSTRRSLIFRYLIETLVVTIFSLVLAALLVNPALSAFRSFIPPGVVFHILDPAVLLFLASLAVITSLFAGIYPAMVLSGLLPIACLRGTTAEKGDNKWFLRRGLIIFQYTVTMFFMIDMIVVSSQLSFIRKKNPGFTSSTVLIVNTYDNGNKDNKVGLLAQKIRQIPGVEEVARESRPPLSGQDMVMSVNYKGKDNQKMIVARQDADENFLSLYRMKLLAGRSLSQSDSLKEFVINETCSKYLGFKNPERAIGQLLYVADKPYPIVGVVSDFHQFSFHQAIKPLCILNVPQKEQEIAIKLAGADNESGDPLNALASIEKQFKDVYPDGTFNYVFFDEYISHLYESDRRAGRLTTMAMCLAILISCLGLFGFIMFISEKRAKEISIRKIMGANFLNIAVLLCKDFVPLIIIASGISSPIAFYVLNRWLQEFAYRVQIGGWEFVLAGASVIIISLITVSFHTIKAAMANPVDRLKSE